MCPRQERKASKRKKKNNDFIPGSNADPLDTNQKTRT